MSLDKFVAWPTLHGLPHHPREGADSQYILVLDLPVECQPGDPPGAGEIIDLNAGISPGISRIVFFIIPGSTRGGSTSFGVTVSISYECSFSDTEGYLVF